MENNFYADDCGVLIGLVSAPPALGEDDFFKMEIEEELSSHYKADRRRYMLKGEFDVSLILTVYFTLFMEIVKLRILKSNIKIMIINWWWGLILC